MTRLFTAIALAAAIVVPTSAASAQSGAAVAPAQAYQTSVAPTAMVRPDVAGIQTHRDENAPLVVNSAVAQGLHQGQGVALMVVGGAALITGLIIGDDAGTAVAVGGLAIGLVGLYQYVR